MNFFFFFARFYTSKYIYFDIWDLKDNVNIVELWKFQLYQSHWIKVIGKVNENLIQSANINVLNSERKIYKYVITFNFNSCFNFSDINKSLSILRIKYCLFICIHDQYYVCQYV